MSNQKLIKVFNLTDVPTKSLEQYGLLSAHIVVGRDLVPPGESVDAVDDAVTRNGLQHYVSIGAVAVDTLPAKYALQKEKMAPPPKVEEEKTLPFAGKKKDK